MSIHNLSEEKNSRNGEELRSVENQYIVGIIYHWNLRIWGCFPLKCRDVGMVYQLCTGIERKFENIICFQSGFKSFDHVVHKCMEKFILRQLIMDHLFNNCFRWWSRSDVFFVVVYVANVGTSDISPVWYYTKKCWSWGVHYYALNGVFCIC